MSGDGDLRRELGPWEAVAIGLGTMIGAGIFLLVGVAVELSGPAAAVSYGIAGVVSLLTAASTAELATGMPRSGGDYYYVSRSLGPLLGAAAGFGIWISLTVAISFYLVGMGQFLAEISPAPPLLSAAAAIVALTALNVVGAKESGRTQLGIVVVLVLVLAGFATFGLLNVELDNLRPFAPLGAGPIMPTTAMIFVSFIGFTGIAVVAEEIIDPDRNLPRTMLGSVVAVTLLYLVIVVVVAGLFTQAELAAVPEPLSRAARDLLGPAGAFVVIGAGLLATLSSANASILASSRVNLAMSRDQLFPRWLAAIHERLFTPYRAIVLTGVIALGFLLVEELEELAQLASSLQLFSYTALNIGAIALRAAGPTWYRPSFRTPGYPYVPLIAAASCIAIIAYSGLAAQVTIIGVVAFAIVVYLAWGRKRSELEHAIPDLRARMTEHGVGALLNPPPAPPRQRPVARPTGERILGTSPPRTVAVAIANPEHEADLMRLGRIAATGAEAGGRVLGIHLHRVPRQTPLAVARAEFERRGLIEREIVDAAEDLPALPDRRPLGETTAEAVTGVTHDIFGALIHETQTRGADLLVMGWEGGFNVGRIYETPVQRIMAELNADLAVLKNRGLSSLDRIAIPWGGGVHARLGLELGVRVADATGAHVDLLRILPDDVDAEDDIAEIRGTVRGIVGDFERIEHRAVRHESVTDGIRQHLTEMETDLVVIGAAAQESRLRSFLFGSIPDVVADTAGCSVLMVRRFLPGA